MKSKKAQVDAEILYSPGFIILIVMAVGATVMGFVMGKRMGYDSFKIWQLLLIIAVEVIACYVFASRG